MNTKAEIVAYLTSRLTSDAAECTHMQVPTGWLRVLIDLPEPTPATLPESGGSDAQAAGEGQSQTPSR